MDSNIVYVRSNPWFILLFILLSMSLMRCQVSGTPQVRTVGSAAVIAGQPVAGEACGGQFDLHCVIPAAGPFVAGVATNSGASGVNIGVLMNGTAPCTFSNLPVQGHTITATAGACVDDGRLITAIPNTTGVVGFVKQVLTATPPYSAIVTLLGPVTSGKLIEPSTFDPSTVPPYIQANQTAQVNADWTSASGVSQILNKPSLAAVALSGSASDLTSGTLPNARLSSIPNASLANASTTVNGQTCTLGSTCTLAVGSGTVTSFATGSWPTWLTPAVTNSTTTPSLAVTSSAIPNSALANSSITVSGTTCTLGSTCAPPDAVTYMTNTGTVLTGVKHIVGSLTTATNGVWSVNYSSAGCSTIRSVQAQAVSPTGSLATQQYVSYYNVPTTTSVGGTVYSGAVLTLLGATIIPITAAATVYYDIVCT